jgi:hypothetical protein
MMSSISARATHQSYPWPQSELVNELEALVDANSISEVLMALALVCFEKAEHVATNWQDKKLAKQWERAGAAINNRISDHPSITAVS